MRRVDLAHDQHAAEHADQRHHGKGRQERSLSNVVNEQGPDEHAPARHKHHRRHHALREIQHECASPEKRGHGQHAAPVGVIESAAETGREHGAGRGRGRCSQHPSRIAFQKSQEQGQSEEGGEAFDDPFRQASLHESGFARGRWRARLVFRQTLPARAADQRASVRRQLHGLQEPAASETHRLRVFLAHRLIRLEPGWGGADGCRGMPGRRGLTRDGPLRRRGGKTAGLGVAVAGETEVHILPHPTEKRVELSESPAREVDRFGAVAVSRKDFLIPDRGRRSVGGRWSVKDAGDERLGGLPFRAAFLLQGRALVHGAPPDEQAQLFVADGSEGLISPAKIPRHYAIPLVALPQLRRATDPWPWSSFPSMQTG